MIFKAGCQGLLQSFLKLIMFYLYCTVPLSGTSRARWIYVTCPRERSLHCSESLFMAVFEQNSSLTDPVRTRPSSDALCGSSLTFACGAESLSSAHRGMYSQALLG
ncbi:hypothetical protein M8818_006498 [Zalaria obscura]|uniref:Uncharacterized protein n=1 Tax=Zalaria obscura TaxID=2024903 RepID=A0ACC3S7T1_9PEZI